MVYKGRFVIFIIALAIMCILAITHKGYVETNMLKTLLPKNIASETEIVNLANKTSSVIKVVIEENTNDEELKNNFISKIDNNYFEVEDYDSSKLINQYLKSPTNFLSEDTRKLLKNKKYDIVYNQALERLYSPIQISSVDKDPYLFLDDFITILKPENNGISEENDKNYNSFVIKIKKREGLSPDLSNKKIVDLIALQKELSKNGNKIYLAGSPIHSYYTSKKSIIDINVICILSTFMIIFLTYFYFRRYKLLIPIAMAIISGMLAGYVATIMWFKDFQIITMVFSTTLIGIGIDYSYHYYFSGNAEKSFVKSLSFSLITTVVPFVLLYTTGIELLKQISIFTSAGLVAIYLIVLFIYPSFGKTEPVKTIEIKRTWVKFAIICLCFLSFVGFLKFKINNTLGSMYSPSKQLMKAEELYNRVSGNMNSGTQFITVNARNEQELLENEEKITSRLEDQNVNFTALSRFIPSDKRQKENYDLVHELYKNTLYKYQDILSQNQIQKLMDKKFTLINIDNSLFKDFLLDKNKSVIVVSEDKKLDFDNVINIQADIENYLKNYSIKLIKIFPPVILIMIIILSYSYGFKKSVKIIIPSICGMIASIGLVILINGEINVFSLIALFMVLGFTIDYSIFRASKNKQTEDAVLVSATTTIFSFLLLSLCGFKLLCSISLILFSGILFSYLVGYLLFENKD